MSRCLNGFFVVYKTTWGKHVPATLFMRPQGRIIQASSNRVLEVVKNDRAGDLLHTELTNLCHRNRVSVFFASADLHS